MGSNSPVRNNEESQFLPSFGTAQKRKTGSSVDSAVVNSTSDIRHSLSKTLVSSEPKSWIERILPEFFWPYAELARLHKPQAISFVVSPVYWAICLSAPAGSLPDPQLLVIFGLWALFMRGAACTVNDIVDKDVDAQVERSKTRPLPMGTVTVPQAYAFLGLQYLLASVVLVRLNVTCQLFGGANIPISCIYPFMKKVTYWPQAWLGIMGAWGIPLGWAALHSDLASQLAVLPLFISCLLWFLIFDTIYGHQDKTFDIKIGVKSTALLFGEKTKSILSVFWIISVGLLAWTGVIFGLGWPFYVGAAVAAGQLAWQILTVDLDNPADCGNKFRSNLWYGMIVCLALLLGNLAAVQA